MLGPRPWDKDAVLSLMIGVFFSISIGVLLASGVQAVNLGLTPPQLEFFRMVIMALAFQAFAFGWIALFLKRRGITWREAFGISTRGYGKALFIGVIAGILLLVPSWVLHKLSMTGLQYFTVPAEQQEVVQRLKVGVPIAQQVFFFFLATIAAPVVEELLFRGMLYPALKSAGYKKFALWGTSVLFAAIHINLMSFVPLLFLGLALVYLYELTDDLLVPMAAHSTFNLINFAAISYETEINNWLTKLQ